MRLEHNKPLAKEKARVLRVLESKFVEGRAKVERLIKDCCVLQSDSSRKRGCIR